MEDRNPFVPVAIRSIKPGNARDWERFATPRIALIAIARIHDALDADDGATCEISLSDGTLMRSVNSAARLYRSIDAAVAGHFVSMPPTATHAQPTEGPSQ